jgi:predicted GIY-YIG superfamily endonuclease
MTNMIYILALEDNCFYVGRTENLPKRIRDHFSGRGAAWTKVHRPIGVVKTIRCRHNEEEDMWTKKMMGQYSVAQVRGGSHCQVTLDGDQKKYLERERRHNSNSCFICSKEGHYAK